MSRRSTVVVGVAILVAFAQAVGAASAAAAEWPATVVTVAGAAEVQAGGGTAWAKAELRGGLAEGDAIRTAAATRLSLRTASGHGIRLGPGTRLWLLHDAGPGDRAARLRMASGWLWAAVLPSAGAHSQIDVEVGSVTVGVARGGIGIRVNRDGSVLVRVHHGAAACTGPGDRREWERALGDGQELAVSAAGAPGMARPLTGDAFEAEWVKWNGEQDRAGGYAGRAPGRR